MSAIEKAAAILREEAKALKACHTLRGDWCGDPAEADYHEMIAAADAALAERDALRAKIAEMEKQEPVATVIKEGDSRYWMSERLWTFPNGKYPLYALPGAQAQPTPSTKDAIIDDLQSQFDSDGITEHDSGDALIRLSDAIAAVEDNFAQPAPSFADAYQVAMEEVAIWEKRALEAEELNRKFIAEINGPTHIGEPAQPAPSVPDGWKLVPTAESGHPAIYRMLAALHIADRTAGLSEWDSYRAMLAEAPEAKT